MSAIRKFLFLVIGALLVLSIIIFEPFRTEPFKPHIVVNGSEIPFTQGSYCWMGLIRGRCVDFIYTSPIEMARKHKPTVVSPNDKIEIDFKRDPISESLQVEQWINENEQEIIELEDGSFSVPKDKGIYVYHIFAWWKQGDGNYAFSVEVK